MKKLLLALALIWPFPALAVPNSTAYVVTTCGTLPTPPGPWLPRADPNNAAALTVDVNGTLCTNGTFTGTVTSNSTVKATAADPTYIEGSTSNPVSVNLAGYARSLVKAVAGALADGAIVTLGLEADAKSTATDTTAVSIMQVLKEISFMEQTPASRAVTQGTSPWIVSGSGTAGTPASGVVTVQGISSGTAVAVTVGAGSSVIGHVITDSGSVTQANVASGGIASGAIASGAFASGAIGSGAVASGAIASGAVASGAFASGSVSDGAVVTLGAKADAKSTATDTTAVTIMSVLKEISAMVQAPASTPVTNVGTFAVQAQPTPVTSGGLSWYTVQPAASDNHVVIKAGAGQVYHIGVTNNSATINYLRLYNATTGFNGCNSSTNLVYSQEIPASTSGAGFVEDISQGIAFATGISICVTSVYGNTDTTNATATAMQVNVGYK